MQHQSLGGQPGNALLLLSARVKTEPSSHWPATPFTSADAPSHVSAAAAAAAAVLLQHQSVGGQPGNALLLLSARVNTEPSSHWPATPFTSADAPSHVSAAAAAAAAVLLQHQSPLGHPVNAPRDCPTFLVNTEPSSHWPATPFTSALAPSHVPPPGNGITYPSGTAAAAATAAARAFSAASRFT